MRASKYRHVYGQVSKKELCYENLRVSKNAFDSNIIQTNGKYLSVNWESSGGGAFAIIPLNEFGKAPDTVSLFRGHKGPVLDTAFNPFNEQQIASCSDDGNICLWEIPRDYSFHSYLDENNNIKDITEPVKVLEGHGKKVLHLTFHPCAENVLASCSMDYTVKIWNLSTGKAEITLPHKDLVTSFAFNYNGTLLATSCRDKRLRIWDIRKGEILSEGPGHTGAKPSRIIWLGNTDRVATSGFSKLSDRQIGIWDINHIDAGPINGFLVVDQSSGVLIPIFDEGNSILYLAGKGDGNIRYYEYENDILHELSQFGSIEPQRGFAVAPKYSVNVRENEILRSFKTVNDITIEPVSFYVPRRSELFQRDIYPDCPSRKPAMSAHEYFEGKTCNGPLLMSMEALYEGSESKLRESETATSINVAKENSKKRQQEKDKEAAERKRSKDEQRKEQEHEASKSTKVPSGEEKSDGIGKPVGESLASSSEVNHMLNKVNDETTEDKILLEVEDNEWEEVKKSDLSVPGSPKPEISQDSTNSEKENEKKGNNKKGENQKCAKDKSEASKATNKNAKGVDKKDSGKDTEKSAKDKSEASNQINKNTKDTKKKNSEKDTQKSTKEKSENFKTLNKNNKGTKKKGHEYKEDKKEVKSEGAKRDSKETKEEPEVESSGKTSKELKKSEIKLNKTEDIINSELQMTVHKLSDLVAKLEEQVSELKTSGSQYKEKLQKVEEKLESLVQKQ